MNNIESKSSVERRKKAIDEIINKRIERSSVLRKATKILIDFQANTPRVRLKCDVLNVVVALEEITQDIDRGEYD